MFYKNSSDEINQILSYNKLIDYSMSTPESSISDSNMIRSNLLRH